MIAIEKPARDGGDPVAADRITLFRGQFYHLIGTGLLPSSEDTVPGSDANGRAHREKRA